MACCLYKDHLHENLLRIGRSPLSNL